MINMFGMTERNHMEQKLAQSSKSSFVAHVYKLFFHKYVETVVTI